MSSEPIERVALTDDEHAALELTGELWGLLCRIASVGPTREQDLSDLGAHVHVIQRAIMSQAAGRAYPNRYRLLGSVLPSQMPASPPT